MLPTPEEPRLDTIGGPGAVGNSVEPPPPAVLSYFNARDRAGRVGRPQTLAGMASVVCMA